MGKIRRKGIGTVFSILLLSVLLCPQILAAGLPTELVPVGRTIGINMKCDGVMIIALNEVETANGVTAPGVDAGLLPGDIITRLGPTEVNSSEDFKSALEALDTDVTTLHVVRDGKTLQLTLKPALNAKGERELGLWVRDGIAGIGTMTFYDPASGVFGALGHAVSDIETGAMMPLRSGSILSANITGVVHGEPGAPGQLQGEFNFDHELGTLYANTQAGIFGELRDTGLISAQDPLPVAKENEIELGAATILSNVSGTDVASYEVEISRIFTGGADRNVMITVTDPVLLEKTGGIVQGMSGSPIIQNGKLVGAVTHVLINNPQKGYGISIESMLKSGFSDTRSSTVQGEYDSPLHKGEARIKFQLSGNTGNKFNFFPKFY